MKNLRAKLTRSVLSDVIASAAGSCFATAGFLWCPIAGFCVLGTVLAAAAWGVAE